MRDERINTGGDSKEGYRQKELETNLANGQVVYLFKLGTDIRNKLNKIIEYYDHLTITETLVLLINSEFDRISKEK